MKFAWVSMLALVTAGCFDSTLPSTVTLSCRDGSDCPAGLFCLGGEAPRCVGVGADAPCVEFAGSTATAVEDGTSCGGGQICIDGDCVSSRCGDGIVTAPETCDGERDCRADCSRCGDGVIDEDEACDNGDNNSDVQPGACRIRCALATCGDGVRDPGEGCDDSDANSDVEPDTCRTTCERPACGDGVRDQGEFCDDANTASGDGCRSDCGKIERCGDGLLDSGERCDDGNDNPRDGCDRCAQQDWEREIVVGQRARDGLRTRMATVQQLTIDALGRIWVASSNTPGVFRLDRDGTMTLVAGTRGRAGQLGDGGPARLAALTSPSGAALDPLGRLLIADQSGSVRRVDEAGIIRRVASTPVRGVYVSPGGVIFLTEPNGGRIRRLNTDDTLTVVASGLSVPSGVVADAAGVLYVAEESGHRVTRIDRDGVVTPIAGTGTAGFSGDDGLATTAALNGPRALALDANGALYIADTGNHRVRRVGLDGLITTVAGNRSGGMNGTEGAAVDIALNTPRGIVIDARGDLIIADGDNNLLRRVDAAGHLTTIGGLIADENEPALSRVAEPAGFAFDEAGAVLLADRNFHRVRRVDLVTGGPTSAQTVVGDAPSGFGGDGGDALFARLFGPTDIARFDDGRLAIVDSGNRRLRLVDTDDVITTVAGDGTGGPLVHGALATASPASPRSVAIAPDGALCLVDPVNHAVACIDAIDGRLQVVAGGRGAGNSGDGGPATLAQLRAPHDLAFDIDGAILIADTDNHVIRRIDPATGIITRLVGGVAGSADGPALSARLSRPVGVAVSPDGRVCIADAGNRRVRCLTPSDGLVQTVAGTGAAGIGGDGGPAVEARVGELAAIGFDAAGRLHFTSAGGTSEADHRLRRIEFDGTVTTLVGQVHPVGNGDAAVAQLYGPSAIALLGDQQLVSVGAFDRLQRWDIDADEVEVALGYDAASPTVQGLARFAPLLQGAAGLAYDRAAGLLFITEQSARRLRVVDVGAPSGGGTDAPATWTSTSVTTTLAGPAGVAIDLDSDALIVADELGHCVRRVGRDGAVQDTIFGVCGTPGFLPGFLNRPTHVVVSPMTGAVYVADTGNHRVLRVEDGVASVVVGDRSISSAGEGAPARLFPVHAPRQLAMDDFGNLFVSSVTTVRLVANVDDDDDADGDDRVSTIFGGGDRLTFPESDTFCLNTLAMADDGDLYAADACQGYLVKISPVIE